MKRFSAREFALLCLPVAVVAGAGFWAIRRPVYVKPKLLFRVETPSALEAFKGTQMVLVSEVSQDSANTHYGVVLPFYRLAVRTSNNNVVWKSGQGAPSRYIRFGNEGNTIFRLWLNQVPEGEITFGLEGLAAPLATFTPTAPKWAKPYYLNGEHKVDRSLWKPYNFDQPRVPLILLRSVTISDSSPKSVFGRIEFSLRGAKMDGNTDSQVELTEAHNNLTSWGFSSKNNTSSRARYADFTIKAPIAPLGKQQKIVSLTGRASADNRWPLVFEIGPFDYTKAKVGQQLKFKSWPAPLPPGVALKK